MALPGGYRPKWGRVPGNKRPILVPKDYARGHWVSDLVQLSREKGYVHTKGKHAGQPNCYRIAIESGVSYELLLGMALGSLQPKKAYQKGGLGLTQLGRLCDFFEVTPERLLRRCYCTAPLCSEVQRIVDQSSFMAPDPDSKDTESRKPAKRPRDPRGLKAPYAVPNPLDPSREVVPQVAPEDDYALPEDLKVSW